MSRISPETPEILFKPLTSERLNHGPTQVKRPEEIKVGRTYTIRGVFIPGPQGMRELKAQFTASESPYWKDGSCYVNGNLRDMEKNPFKKEELGKIVEINLGTVGVVPYPTSRKRWAYPWLEDPNKT